MPGTPSEAELIRAAIDARLRDLHVALPGRVHAYHADRETVDVKPQIRRPLVVEGEIEFEDLPVIPDVPIAWPSGNGGACFITWPLAVGDPVELVFQDFDLGLWRAVGQPGTPGDLRAHGLSGAVAYPGLRANTELLGASKRHASKVVIGSAVLLGASTAAEALVKGTAYRGAEDTMLAAIKAQFTALSGSSTGPLSPLAAGFTALAAAITTFEGSAAGAGGFLSSKHKMDL